MKFKNNFTPVLLMQGLSTPAIAAGTEASQNYNVSDGRGDVHRIDFISSDRFNYPLATSYTNAYWSLIIGGQEVVQNESFARYSPFVDLGDRDDRAIKMIIPESQVIRFKGVNPGGAPPTATQGSGALILQYQTQQHAEFLKSFKWKFGEGLKRRTYRINIPSGTAANTFNLNDVLPRNSGDIIAVSILETVSLGSAQALINLSVNGINVIENVPSAAFNPQSCMPDWIKPIFIQPGSTFNFQVQNFVAPTADDNYYITFYFNN